MDFALVEPVDGFRRSATLGSGSVARESPLGSPVARLRTRTGGRRALVGRNLRETAVERDSRGRSPSRSSSLVVAGAACSPACRCHLRRQDEPVKARLARAFPDVARQLVDHLAPRPPASARTADSSGTGSPALDDHQAHAGLRLRRRSTSPQRHVLVDQRPRPSQVIVPDGAVDEFGER